MFLDLKNAVRSIAVSPRFAAVVIITLALGTGANTAVFSVLNAVVLKPLKYDEPERLVRVYHSSGDDNGYLTGPAAVDYRDHSRTLDIAITYTYSVQGADLTSRGEPERVRTMLVSADYFVCCARRRFLDRRLTAPMSAPTSTSLSSADGSGASTWTPGPTRWADC